MMDEKTINRFMKFVDNDRYDECWIWFGARTDRGYGAFTINGKNISAHRFSYEVFNKTKIPDGLLVCHKCDVRECVNPNHLFIGTHSDNYHDMTSKGRGNKHKLGRKKLSMEDAKMIRKMVENGEWKTIVGAKFGVSRHLVNDIVMRRIYTEESA